MEIDRRAFMSLAATAVLRHGSPAIAGQDAPRRRFKAIAFDAFPIFDPRPVAALAETRFPGQGAALMDVWRSRQFEYQWLRALGGRYADFSKATEDSLKFAAVHLRLEMPDDVLQELAGAYIRLNVWGDVPAALQALRTSGLRLAMLSNMTRAMLIGGLARAGLSDLFEAVLSTDTIRSYKPDPKAYAMGVNTLKLRRDEILFVPFAGWDVAGAKWFGYPTFWVNRAQAPLERLDVTPDASGIGLNDLQAFVLD